MSGGKGVSLQYGKEWLASGFAISEDLPLADTEFLPPGRLFADAPRAVGAVDDARPDRWGEKVIRFVDKPQRLSLMECVFYAGDDLFGALGVSTSAERYEPRSGGPLPRLQDAQHLSEVVTKIEAAEPLTALEARIIAGGGNPLGGAKPKVLIDIDGDAASTASRPARPSALTRGGAQGRVARVRGGRDAVLSRKNPADLAPTHCLSVFDVNS